MANDDSFFETHSSTITYRYEFAYQSGRWVLKTIKSLYEGVFSQEDVITAVLGIKEGVCRFITEPAGVDFNKKWFALIKPYVD